MIFSLFCARPGIYANVRMEPFNCGTNIEKSAALGRALVKIFYELELFNLGVELILVLVIGKHFVAVGECAAQRIAEGRFSLDLLVDFRNDVLEEEFVASSSDVVLVEVHVVAAFDHLEQIGLARVLGGQVACDRHVALFNVVLLHADYEAVNRRNAMNRIIVYCEFSFWGDYTGASREEECCECDGCPNDVFFHVLILLF